MAVETIEDRLTNSLWDHWKTQDTATKLTWLEVQKLACALTKLSRQSDIDYQEFDFQSLIDSKLTYYENLSVIEEAVYQVHAKDETYSKEEMETAGAALGFSEDIVKNLQVERDKLQSKVSRQEKTLEELKQKTELANKEILELRNKPPQEKIIYVTMQPEPEPKKPQEPAYDPVNAPYTDAELLEIQQYLLSRNPKPKMKPAKPQTHYRETTKKTLLNSAKILWKVIY